MKCAKCGTELREGAKFCKQCGTKAEQELRCPECGAKLAGDEIFCEECGHRLREETVSIAEEKTSDTLGFDWDWTQGVERDQQSEIPETAAGSAEGSEWRDVEWSSLGIEDPDSWKNLPAYGPAMRRDGDYFPVAANGRWIAWVGNEAVSVIDRKKKKRRDLPHNVEKNSGCFPVLQGDRFYWLNGGGRKSVLYSMDLVSGAAKKERIISNMPSKEGVYVNIMEMRAADEDTLVIYVSKDVGDQQKDFLDINGEIFKLPKAYQGRTIVQAADGKLLLGRDTWDNGVSGPSYLGTVVFDVHSRQFMDFSDYIFGEGSSYGREFYEKQPQIHRGDYWHDLLGKCILVEDQEGWTDNYQPHSLLRIFKDRVERLPRRIDAVLPGYEEASYENLRRSYEDPEYEKHQYMYRSGAHHCGMAYKDCAGHQVFIDPGFCVRYRCQDAKLLDLGYRTYGECLPEYFQFMDEHTAYVRIQGWYERPTRHAFLDFAANEVLYLD